MNPIAYRLRSDLHIAPVRSGNDLKYIVDDKLSGRIVRLGKMEYTLCSLFVKPMLLNDAIEILASCRSWCHGLCNRDFSNPQPHRSSRNLPFKTPNQARWNRSPKLLFDRLTRVSSGSRYCRVSGSITFASHGNSLFHGRV